MPPGCWTGSPGASDPAARVPTVTSHDDPDARQARVEARLRARLAALEGRPLDDDEVADLAEAFAHEPDDEVAALDQLTREGRTVEDVRAELLDHLRRLRGEADG